MSVALPPEPLGIRALITPLLVMLTLLGLTACGGGGSDNGGGTPQPATGTVIEGNFFPLDTGNRWTYAVTDSMGGAYYSTDRIMPAVTLDGRSVTVIRSSNTDTGESWGDTYLEKTATALTTIEPANGSTLEFIRLPLRMGDTFVKRESHDMDVGEDWDGDSIHETVSVRDEVTILGLEDVGTDAGRFTQALKIQNVSHREFRYSHDNRLVPVTITLTTWFAREVGKVREQETRTYIDGVVTISTSLSAYRTATRTGELTAPSISTNTPPASGAMGPYSPLQLTFSERMDADSFTPASLMLLTPDQTPLSGTITLSNRTATFHPTDPLPAGNYTLRADASLCDLSGNRLGRTIDLPVRISADSLSILSVSPADFSGRIPVDSAVTVEFNEVIDQASINATDIYLRETNAEHPPPVPATLSTNGRFLTLTPQAPLSYGNQYTLLIFRLKDIQGHALPSVFMSTFFTISQPPRTVLASGAEPATPPRFRSASARPLSRRAFTTPSLETGIFHP